MNSIKVSITGMSLDGKSKYFEAYLQSVPRIGETVVIDYEEYLVESVTWHFAYNTPSRVSVKAKEV